MRTAVLVAGVVGLACASCASAPPPHWGEGGSPIDLPRARWERKGGQIVDIMPDGRVLIDGAHVFSLDQAGRVIDNDRTPIAVLGQDGKLVGGNNAQLGSVGVRNAAPPKGNYAWFAIDDAGEVTRYDAAGEETSDGKWAGCGSAVRTCTLTTQVVIYADRRAKEARPVVQPGGPTVGFTPNGMVVVP